MNTEQKDFLYPDILTEQRELVADKVDFYLRRIYELYYKGLKTQTTVNTTIEANPALNNSAWPIGSIFITVAAGDPSTLLGFGTWTRFATGRVLVGWDPSNPMFDTIEETG